MTPRRIVRASVSASLGSLLGIAAISPAGLAEITQSTVYNPDQQTLAHSKDQDKSTPKQGLPGRRIPGGTRHSYTFIYNQT
ncbi:hypothetical protein [cf. Phormidesmis sp. LEGE 11477]|uniref:hypothetical protein n=1 Tax=cf. Phormidesmis sp. LEGE 11477 TaxID=1828680 RepID=UPI0018805D7C|nr:hypothetical protein [cf. Phormidesmis sp. LEGE 11477]MBE9062138.1 hypothetical protein [cf. Phormidesmis sp. LEGE 11477]